MARSRVVVADAEPIFAEVVGAALRRYDDIHVAPTYPATAAEAVQVIGAGKPDVALVDIELPGMRRFALVQLLVQRSPGTKVIATSLDAGSVELEEVASAGIWGSTDKCVPPLHVADMVRYAASGHDATLEDFVYLQSLEGNAPPFGYLDARDHRSPEEQQLLRSMLDLSPRQIEVLDRLRAGRSVQQIADELRISASTVRHHVHALRAQTGASSQLEAVAVARRAGLLDDWSGLTTPRSGPRRGRNRRSPSRHSQAADGTRYDVADPSEVAVAVAAPERLFARGLVAVLEDSPDLEVLPCTANLADETETLVATHSFKVLVLKLGMAGLDIRRLLRAATRPISIVAVGSRGGPAAATALTDGATAYVSETASLPDLIEAIVRARRGDRYVVDPGVEAPQRPSPSLSARDRVVLGLLDGGLSAKQVANQLSLSVATVRSVIQRLMLKFEAHTRVELIALARAAGALPSVS